MKQILVVLAAIFSLFMLNSCDNENLGSDDSGNKIIQFQVKALDLESGAVEGPDTKLDVEGAQFEIGDEIGLFAVKRKIGVAATNDDLKNDIINNFIHNAKLTYDGKSWVSDLPIYYPEDRTEVAIDFYAYYPYRESVNPNEMNISDGVLTNQEGRSTLGKSDFMTASCSDYKLDGGKVKLEFRHHFSLVRLEYQIPDSKPEFNSVAMVTPEYPVDNFKLIAVAKGQDLSYKKSDDVKKIAIGMHPKEKEKNTVVTYEALVIPQSIEVSKSDEALFYCFDDKDTRFFHIFLEEISGDKKQINLSQGNAYTFIYKKP
jgi:hypothetical protein